MPSFNEISPQQLMRLLGGPDTPVIADVCTDEDFALDQRLIPTSVRIPAADIAQISARNPNRHVIVVCQKGKKLSHGAVALLQADGVSAEVLSGGIFGWRDTSLPLVPASEIPPIGQTGSLWVTRQRPKIDRIACPWLIRRFVDPNARFLFVPHSEVMAVSERFDATPFDVDDAKFTHQDGLCSFDSLIKAFGLSHPPLDKLASVVRAADTGQPENSPQAEGLLAISVGFSRLYKNDQDQLSAAMPIYDALYRWARDGATETHQHPTGTPK